MTGAADGLDLRLTFLRQVHDRLGDARAALARFASAPADPDPLREVVAFFHLIAGSAGSVDFAALGHAASACERAGRLAGRLGPGELPDLVAILRDGLGAVAATLEASGVILAEPAAPSSGALSLPPPRASVAPPSPGAAPERLEAASFKVLVVDDDALSARMIDACLRGAGFQSRVCLDGAQAMRAIQAELPDLVVLDVVMPGVGGLDLCRRIRAHPAMQLVPIVFVTRRGDVDQRVRGLEAGANDYLTKPFEPRELVARVRSHLERHAALRDLAIRDGLTRCYNHRFFKERLDHEIARARRYKGALALLMLDVDHFKSINDAKGHPAGDAVLVHLAEIIRASVRTTDVVSRYGGEEFVVLLVQASLAEAQLIAHRIRLRVGGSRIAVPSPSGELERVGVTVSLGVAELREGDTAASFLGRADASLYAAKTAGRNRVVIG